MPTVVPRNLQTWPGWHFYRGLRVQDADVAGAHLAAGRGMSMRRPAGSVNLGAILLKMCG